MLDRIQLAHVSYDLAGAAQATGISLTTLQEAIADNLLVAHYVGRKATKPILRAVDLDAYIESLPTERRAAS